MKYTLPTYEHDGYTLENGLQIHIEHPKTFYVPSQKEKLALKAGNIVKLIYYIRIIQADGKEVFEGERMWTIIKKIDGDYFSGVLDNNPYCTNEMKAGLEVTFKSEHIIAINDMGVDIDDLKFKGYKKYIEDENKKRLEK